MRYSLILFFFTLSLLAAEYKPLNRPYDVEHYELKFQFDPHSKPKTFVLTTTIKLKTLADLQSIELDREGLRLESAKLLPQNTKLEVKQDNAKLFTVLLGKTFPKNSSINLELQTTTDIQTGHFGFFKVTDPDEPERGELFFTHLEPTEARRVYPCNDEPYDKASFDIIGQVPLAYEVLSNGVRLKDKLLKVNQQDYREIHWSLAKPQSTYLLSLAVGTFASLKHKAGSTDLTVWVGRTKTDKAKFVTEATTHSLEFFEKYLSVKYPWPKYAIVGVPTFLWGGMENTSSTHMNQERTLLNDPSSAFERKRITNLTAHELAHQWFGDYVTMKWWDDVWLNESFASLMGTLAVKNAFKSEEAEIESVMDVWDDYFRQEDGPRSHPIVDKGLSSPDEAFDDINYTKGENVLRMLSDYLGETNFRKGVSLYLNTYGYANANFKDFFSSMEKASKTKLDTFVESWLLKRGYPVIQYQTQWDTKTSTLTLTLSQRPNHKEDSHVYDIRLPVVFHRKNTPAFSETRVVEFKEANKSISVKLSAEPDWVTVNPRSIVLAKIEETDLSESTVSQQALLDPDPITRVRASFALAKSIWIGEKATDLSIKTLQEVLNTDKSPYVRNALLESFKRMKAKSLPEALGLTILSLAKETSNDKYLKFSQYLSDTHGWSQWRSNLLSVLGKVENREVLPFLSEVLKNRNLRLDDLQMASLAVAATGQDEAFEILKQANALHAPRGYRYKYHLTMAFGAFQSPKAVKEIEKISETVAPDVLGRIGGTIRDNQQLVNSSEWSTFLGKFLIHNDRFGDEVKARLLNTIEEVKTSDVKNMLRSVVESSKSERIKELAKKILDKNFG